MSPEASARLAGLGIEQIAETKEYLLFGRGSCIAMVHGGSPGSSGYMTEDGLAYLVWRDGHPWLVGKGVNIAASAEQVAEVEKFSRDLKEALAAK